MGPAVLIGLGTVRYRSNPFSPHEVRAAAVASSSALTATSMVITDAAVRAQVHIDAEQLRWFEGELERAGGKPVVVFSHAPILGSGLRVSAQWAQGVSGGLCVG